MTHNLDNLIPHTDISILVDEIQMDKEKLQGYTIVLLPSSTKQSNGNTQ